MDSADQRGARASRAGPPFQAVAHLEGSFRLPNFFVRKEAKKYGTERLIEGPDIEGRRLLTVEDVVTAGGQVVLSTDDLRAAGAEVTDALCVIDRESGAPGTLAASGIALHVLFTMSDLRRQNSEVSYRELRTALMFSSRARGVTVGRPVVSIACGRSGPPRCVCSADPGSMGLVLTCAP